jgi:hypothetical protein
LTSILSASFHTSLRWTSHSAPCGVHEYASVASVRPPCDVRKYLIGLGWNRLLALTTEEVPSLGLRPDRVLRIAELAGLECPRPHVLPSGGTSFPPIPPFQSLHQKAVTAVLDTAPGPDKNQSRVPA